MDIAQWPQAIGVAKTVGKKPRPQKEQAVNCPRCNSTNTKFCYYNNYSLSQPRYFCKTCRRYWTEGGSLRNVPVGGGSRKHKRSSSSAILSSKNNKVIISDNLSPPNFSSPHQNPKIHEGQDLNLAYNPSSHYNIGMSGFVASPFGLENNKNLNPENPNFPNLASHHHLPVMEFLKTGNSNILGTDSSVYNSSGFPLLHDFKPSLGFSVDGFENGYGNLQGVEDHANKYSSRNFLFPFGELKQVSNSDEEIKQERGQGETNGFWTGIGMLTGGSSW